MIATRETLQTLSGFKRPSRIAEWLTSQAIPYLCGADGWPKVAESVIMSRLGAETKPRGPQLRLRNGDQAA